MLVALLLLVALAGRGWGKPFLQQLASSRVASRPQLQISLLVQPSLVNSSLPIGWCGNVRLGRSTGPKQKVQRDPRTSCQEILGLAAADHWAPIKGLIFGGAFAKWLFARGKQKLGIDSYVSQIDMFPFAENMTDVIYLQYWQSNNSNFPKFNCMKYIIK